MVTKNRHILHDQFTYYVHVCTPDMQVERTAKRTYQYNHDVTQSPSENFDIHVCIMLNRVLMAK